MKLLNAPVLFQRLLTASAPEGATVANDLDVDAFDEIPFITHTSILAQDRNGRGLWSVTLTINIFLDPSGAHEVVSAVYEAIHAWGEDPDAAIVPGVGAVETVEDLNAFIPVSGEIAMVNKTVRHYQGTFNIGARVH